MWKRTAATLLSLLLLPAEAVYAGGPLTVGGPFEGISGVPLLWDNTKPIAYRYQTCVPGSSAPGTTHNLPCINGLPGAANIQQPYYSFQVSGTGATPVTFYLRVSDARGDARPDFIYTLNIFGVN